MRKQKSKNAQEEILSYWQLIWRQFKKHRLAIGATIVLIVFYFTALFCEFIAPYDPHHRFSDRQYVPPQRLHFFDEEGKFHFRPFLYGIKAEFNPKTWQYTFVPVEEEKYSFCLFTHGDEYKLWGLFKTDLHLFGVEKGGTLFLLGTDNLSRDLVSRIIYASRISLSIGLMGVFISLLLGMIFGGISGLYGGFADNVIQRVIEILICIPTIPLWMALSAALPKDWSPVMVFFGIIIILSLIGWCNLARVVRGKFISLREEDFILAAKTYGASQGRIISHHMIPNFMSYILVNVTLAIPAMILGETALSFLGLGLHPPIISWGVLLQQAQNFQVVALYPWLLIPGMFVVIAVLCFNFVGDGLRDAADPYAKR